MTIKLFSIYLIGATVTGLVFLTGIVNYFYTDKPRLSFVAVLIIWFLLTLFWPIVWPLIILTWIYADRQEKKNGERN